MPVMPHKIVQKNNSKLVKAKFKRLIRKVILCKAILLEMDTKIGLNAKRNIIILTRRKRNTSFLSSNEKLLFFKPIKNRTDADRESIVKIVAGLKCFQIFPPKLRARVAPHMIYMKIDSNRDIIRQGHVALNVYFILQGEIVAHDSVQDIYTKNRYRVDRFIAAAGDIIGHVALLKSAKRSFSYTAVTDIDCLSLSSDIFIQYLLPFCKHYVESKYLALSKLYILDKYNTTQKVFIALFAQLREYQTMETIYYKDRGDLNFVFFIISGQCMILQKLKTKSFKNYKNEKDYILYPMRPPQSSHVQQINATINKRKTIYLIKEIKEMMDKQQSGIGIGAGNSQISNQSHSSSKTSAMSETFMHGETENFFLDVGTLSYGAMFGLGEPMEDRAIMARTNVQCLLVPRFWLFAKEQNPGNIWQRLRLSFKNVIPSREQLFEYFRIDKSWKKFCEVKIYEALDNERNITNPTKINDIPLICRIVDYNLTDKDDIQD